MGTFRLLVVDHAVEMGGAERVLLRFLDRLDRSVFEVGLACPHPGPLTEAAEERGMRVHLGFPSPRLLDIRRRSLAQGAAAFLYPVDFVSTVVRLRRLIREEGYHIVLTNSAKGDIYGTLAARLAGVPVAWRLHDVVTTEAFSRLNVLLLKGTAGLLAHRVLAVSGAVKEAFVGGLVREEKVKVVYNGVAAGGERRRSRAEVREEWGIPADVPLAGMVGRLVDWKGPDYFLRAAALVAEDLEEARFMLVGDALFGERAYVEELKALVRELGIEERVVFTGFREDVEDVMGCLDLVVHASVLPDPLPTVLIEALGMGLPVVATEGGGVREIVENGECGLVVPPRDARAMAEAMKTLLRDGELAARMGEEGRRKVQATFDPEVTSRELQEELLRLLEVRKPREGRRGPRGRWRA